MTAAMTAAMTMAACDFLPMGASDVDAVLRLERQIYAFPWTRGNFIDALAAGYGAWLLHHDGGLAAYAVLLLAPDEAQLLNISVAPERQRAGLGGALLAFLRDQARAGGALRMLLEVRASNASAQAFYRDQGFAEIARRRGYYPALQGREDALVLELPL